MQRTCVPWPGLPCPALPCPALPCPALPCFNLNSIICLQDYIMHITRCSFYNMTPLQPSWCQIHPPDKLGNLSRMRKAFYKAPHSTSVLCVQAAVTPHQMDPPLDPQLVNVDWGVCECNQTMQVHFLFPRCGI